MLCAAANSGTLDSPCDMDVQSLQRRYTSVPIDILCMGPALQLEHSLCERHVLDTIYSVHVAINSRQAILISGTGLPRQLSLTLYKSMPDSCLSPRPTSSPNRQAVKHCIVRIVGSFSSCKPCQTMTEHIMNKAGCRATIHLRLHRASHSLPCLEEQESSVGTWCAHTSSNPAAVSISR